MQKQLEAGKMYFGSWFLGISIPLGRQGSAAEHVPECLTSWLSQEAKKGPVVGPGYNP